MQSKTFAPPSNLRAAAEPQDGAASLLAQTPIFRDVEADVLTRLSAISSVRLESEGVELCTQGQAADHLWVLLEGQVALANVAPSGARAVVEVIPPGGHFILSAVLSGMPCLMSARGVTRTKLIAVDALALRQLVHRDISLATAMLRAEAEDFGAMVRQVCDLKMRTTAQRLGCYLLDLVDVGSANSASLRLPFDKRLLAARLGCRQENLSRAFAALRRLGVETHGARVILHDVASLRDYALPGDEAEPA